MSELMSWRGRGLRFTEASNNFYPGERRPVAGFKLVKKERKIQVPKSATEN